jgi:hypothetical protein
MHSDMHMQNACRVATVAPWCRLHHAMDIGDAKNIGPGSKHLFKHEKENKSSLASCNNV